MDTHEGRDMTCIVGREKKTLIRRAPYDVSVGISRHFPSRFVLHLSRGNAISTITTIPPLFLYYFFRALLQRALGYVKPELNSLSNGSSISRPERQESQRANPPRLVRCRIFFPERDVTLASLVCARSTRSFLRRPRAVTYN